MIEIKKQTEYAFGIYSAPHEHDIEHYHLKFIYATLNFVFIPKHDQRVDHFSFESSRHNMHALIPKSNIIS